MTRSPRPLSAVFSWLLLALPIVVYGWFFGHYAVNVPKWDDHVLKYFLLKFYEASSFTDRVHQFIRQHNEHRIILDRLVAWVDFSLFGKLNYVHLMVVGNAALAGLLAVLTKALRRSATPPVPYWMALPVSLLLFNLAQWENMFWGMASLQNFTVVTLVMATLYVLSFRNRVGWAAIGLAVLASCTSGNGLMVWPVGLLLLLVRQDFAGVVRWLLAGAITIRLYFLGYEKPPGNPPPKGTLADMLKGWLAFNGSGFEAFPLHPVLSVCAAGGALLTLAAIAIALRRLVRYRQGKDRSGWALFFGSSIAFLLGTGLIVAYSRVGFGAETLITSRYKIYSLTLMALLYAYGIAHVTRTRRVAVAGAGTLLAGGLAFYSYSTFLDDTIQLRKMLLTDQFNWTYTDNRLTNRIDPVTRRLIDNAPAFYDHCLEALRQPADDSPPIRPDSVYRVGQELVMQQDSFPALGIRDEGVYMLARSAKRTYLFPARQQFTHSRRGWLQPDRLFRAGVVAPVSETSPDAGRYTLYWLVVGPEGVCRMYPTGQTLTSSGQPNNRPPQNW